MIANIPTHDDFYKTGEELLVFSWDIVAKLLINLDDAQCFGVDKEEVSEEYWSLASRQLSTAFAMTQQGVEFILKGRICEISPYLLISDSPSRWPSPNNTGPIEFSKFRTLDSQDLVKVLDTFSNNKLDDRFIQRFNDLREKRNVIMHSLSTSLNLHFSEVIETLLFMHSTLFPSKSWAKIRKEGISNHPNSELGGSDYVSNEVCREMDIIINLLTPVQVEEFFKINKAGRAYFCPKCCSDANHDIDFEFKLARLTSRNSDCSSIYCPVCDSEYQVTRKDCDDDKSRCLGNVISDTHSICLTCGG